MIARDYSTGMFPSVGVFRLTSCVLFGFVVFASGCGGPKEAADFITGKVTVAGKPVGGTITFQVGDKSATGPILNGNYSVANPPKGEAVVLIKGMPGIPGAGVAPKGTAGTGTLGATADASPPAKYADPSGGLKFTVKGGKQTHDIDLTP